MRRMTRSRLAVLTACWEQPQRKQKGTCEKWREGRIFPLFLFFFFSFFLFFSVYSPVVAGSGLHDYSVLPAGSYRLFGFR